MALSKHRLGDFIALDDVRNRDGLYDESSVRGIATSKKFIKTKADLDGVSLDNYKVVQPACFAFVPDTSRRGDKISLAYNNTSGHLLVSSISVAFNCDSAINPDYLFMYFNRPEFDRYSRFNSWGSARETFSWDDMCDTEIDLPPLEIQEKYVAIYKAMLKNQQCFEQGLNDLKLACDAALEKLMKTTSRAKLEPYVTRHDVRNKDNSIKNVKGVSVFKEFREPTSKVDRTKLENYKIVKPGQFSFVQTTNNEKVFAFALNTTKEPIVVTSVNEVFSVNEKLIAPEYLALFFMRPDFDRYARFHSWGSARETFTWSDLIAVEIPLPSLEIQHSVANLYTSFTQRKSINERLKAQLKDICPVLIKGSLEEASAN